MYRSRILIHHVRWFSLSIEENVEKTKELVAICNEKGMSIEAEVGSIGGEEDGVVGMGECADPQECKMVADLGVISSSRYR